MSQQSNHFDAGGNAVMVDVSQKPATKRIATAEGKIRMNPTAFQALSQGTAAKGDVLGVARLAGIMAVKQTSQLIPLCHPLMTEKAEIEFHLHPETQTICVACTVQTHGKTGVEMEALCGVNIALLTIYDMCKALDKEMCLFDIRLLEKQGGKSGFFRNQSRPDGASPEPFCGSPVASVRAALDDSPERCSSLDFSDHSVPGPKTFRGSPHD